MRPAIDITAFTAIALIVLAHPLTAQATRGADDTGAPPPVAASQHEIAACFVPASGTIYRIAVEGAPADCLAEAHERFTWNREGTAGPAGPAGPQGSQGEPGVIQTNAAGAYDLGNDHGFLAVGELDAGNIPASGAGVRLMWYPRAAAFRAGSVSAGHWDAANIGHASIAAGANTTASGAGSIAAGGLTTASGDWSVAMGFNTTASGPYSTAFGNGATATHHGAFAAGSSNTLAGNILATAMGAEAVASGLHSVALGSGVTASGQRSVALGQATVASGSNTTALGRHASTAGHAGSFVYGDASTTDVVSATTANQFLVRAAGGVRFRTSANLSTGCNIAAGGGAWVCASSRDVKTGFIDVDGEAVLERLARIPIQSWSYIEEGTHVRHIGPTAQDFHAAFGLGDDPEGISMIDADGVNMLGVQALAARTRALREENEALRAANTAMTDRLVELERRLAALEAALAGAMR